MPSSSPEGARPRQMAAAAAKAGSGWAVCIMNTRWRRLRRESCTAKGGTTDLLRTTAAPLEHCELLPKRQVLQDNFLNTCAHNQKANQRAEQCKHEPTVLVRAPRSQPFPVTWFFWRSGYSGRHCDLTWSRRRERRDRGRAAQVSMSNSHCSRRINPAADSLPRIPRHFPTLPP